MARRRFSYANKYDLIEELHEADGQAVVIDFVVTPYKGAKTERHRYYVVGVFDNEEEGLVCLQTEYHGDIYEMENNSEFKRYLIEENRKRKEETNENTST